MRQYEHYYDIKPDEAYFWDRDDPYELVGESLDNFKYLIGRDIVLERYNYPRAYNGAQIIDERFFKFSKNKQFIKFGGNWSGQYDCFWVTEEDYKKLSTRAVQEGLSLREYLDICYYIALGKL